MEDKNLNTTTPNPEEITESENLETEKKPIDKKALVDKILTISGIVLCVILLPLLIMNITMIIKSYTNKDEVPSVGKVVPFIVLTDSMSGTIESGDFIFCKKIDPNDVEVGDIITFYDPAGNGTSVVTHTVIGIEYDDEGNRMFETQGDANLIPDEDLVPAKNVIAEYMFRIPLLGHVSLFMSTTTGLIVCVLVPLALLFGYDFYRRKKYEKENQQDTQALLAELEALRTARDSVQHDAEEIKESAVDDTKQD